MSLSMNILNFLEYPWVCWHEAWEHTLETYGQDYCRSMIHQMENSTEEELSESDFIDIKESYREVMLKDGFYD